MEENSPGFQLLVSSTKKNCFKFPQQVKEKNEKLSRKVVGGGKKGEEGKCHGRTRC